MMKNRSLRKLERGQTEIVSDLESDRDDIVLSPLVQEQPKTKPDDERRKKKRRIVVRKSKERLEPFSHHLGNKTASLESVIIQALISKDRKMLDDALATTDLLIIRHTIADLPASYIENFLNALTTRTLSSPSRMRHLGPWIREVLRQHIGFCMSIPSTKSNLEKLYRHAHLRLRYHSSILRLQGQVDEILYFAQCKRKQKNEQAEDIDASCEPLLKFKEGMDLLPQERQQKSSGLSATILIHESEMNENEDRPPQSNDDSDSFDEFLANGDFE